MIHYKGEAKIDYSNLSEQEKEKLLRDIDKIPGYSQGGVLPLHRTTQKEQDAKLFHNRNRKGLR